MYRVNDGHCDSVGPACTFLLSSDPEGIRMAEHRWLYHDMSVRSMCTAYARTESSMTHEPPTKGLQPCRTLARLARLPTGTTSLPVQYSVSYSMCAILTRTVGSFRFTMTRLPMVCSYYVVRGAHRYEYTVQEYKNVSADLSLSTSTNCQLENLRNRAVRSLPRVSSVLICETAQ
jgi:hypothetical protein